MPIFFDENDLTDKQRGRYDWAVTEYDRIQKENRLRLEATGKEAISHTINPKSALFARLLDGKLPLPYPPPTSYSYPWYDIIEQPGPYHVSLGGTLSETGIANWDGGANTDEHIVLNQCLWGILHKNPAAQALHRLLQHHENARVTNNQQTLDTVMSILAGKPEFTVTYGQWGPFTLHQGRIVRRGRRDYVLNSTFNINTWDGGNPVIVKLLIPGTEIRAKSDATLTLLMEKPHSELASFERIVLATESIIPRSENAADDDLVEFDCDGWILERQL